MTAYGVSAYGTSTYGYTIPPQFRIDPFTASPKDYSNIEVSWVKPAGTIYAWRLIKNMYGFPVDQDDGEILVDVTSGYPGDNFTDTSVIPGAFHYYGFYVQVNTATNTWVRAGVTGCLMLANYGSAFRMLNLIPSFYISSSNTQNELEADPTGNLYLSLFMGVFGWGFDYLRTQYDTYRNVNNPWKIPLNDLYNLASQLGININPDIHPYTLRKAVYNNAVINKQRGTVQGIAAEISALTGWFADLTIGNNLMLSNDQSYFYDPFYLPWSGNITYNVGEFVTYGNFFYKCIATGNYGNPPTGTSASNTWWQAQQNIPDTTDLANSVTGGISTWELIYPGSSNGGPAIGHMYEIVGIPDPLNGAVNTVNGLKATNQAGATADMYLRSLARSTVDIATVTTTFAPDRYQAVADGIPVPYTAFAQAWNPAVLYEPQEIVLYNNQPFMALRASVNSLPPYGSPGTATQDWAPLGFDDRFRFCISAYAGSQASSNVTPFVEWYDAGGNYILRVIARNPGSSVTVPANLCFASFVTGAGTSLASSPHTDDANNTWTVQTGAFNISPYSGGCLYPANETTRSIATVNTGSSNAQVGTTFTTAPNAGWSTGLVLRYVSNTSYLRADMTTLKQNNGGVFATLGTYSSAFQSGDRMIVQLNGTSITVLKNNVSVLSVTSSFNSTSTIFGIISETT